MSYFIFSMPSAGLMLIPPVSNVMPLPTNPITGPPFAAFFGSYVITINAGGSGPPWLTLQNAPMPSSLIFFSP